MKNFFDTTALALVAALGVGGALLAPTPAQAAEPCIRVAAVDLNGDGWIDTPERHMAMNAGFTNLRSGGRLYTTQEEMNQCLQGSEAAFRWLRQANPNYAMYMGQPGMSGATAAVAAPSRTWSPGAVTGPATTASGTGAYAGGYDRGAAYDTPAPQAEAQAKAYLEAKVFGTQAPAGSVGRAGAEQTMMPAAGGPAQGMGSFEQIDANHDGVISQGEWLDYRNRMGGTD